MIGSTKVEITYDGPETLPAIDMFIRTGHSRHSLDSVNNLLQKKRQQTIWNIALDNIELMGPV